MGVFWEYHGAPRKPQSVLNAESKARSAGLGAPAPVPAPALGAVSSMAHGGVLHWLEYHTAVGVVEHILRQAHRVVIMYPLRRMRRVSGIKVPIKVSTQTNSQQNQNQSNQGSGGGAGGGGIP